MRKRRSATLILVIITALLGATLFATLGTSAGPSTASFQVPLSGAAEVPGPGDPDGSGQADLTVHADLGIFCYTLRVSGIEPATAAHIHVQTGGRTGPVAIGLTPPTEGFSTGCVEASKNILNNILRRPHKYYVNVHNAPYPNGAVRGDLPAG